MTAVIGFTWPPFHDTAVSAVVDGKLVFATEEERHTRHKHSAGEWPINAMFATLRFLKSEYGILPGDIDAFAVNYDPALFSKSNAGYISNVEYNQVGGLRLGGYRISDAEIDMLRHVQHSFPGDFAKSAKVYVDYVLSRIGCKSKENIRIYAVPHHLAHAASAFYFSGFRSSAVAVIDGKGERESTTLWNVSGGEFEELLSVPWWGGSLGATYEGISMLLGFGALEGPGKVMGLAPYGKPNQRMANRFARVIETEGAGRYYRLRKPLNRRSHYYKGYSELLTPLFDDLDLTAWDSGRTLNSTATNLAYSLQTVTELGFLSLAEIAKRRTGNRNLCIAGGVGLNSKAGMAIHYSGLFGGLFVFPAANDAGTSAGAAAYVYQNVMGGKMGNGKLHDVYLGPQYDKGAVEDVIKRAHWDAENVGGDVGTLAEILKNGGVLGIYSGRSEFGPRALGHRSLVANPTDKRTLEKMNIVKSREWWRPLAPSLLAEDKGVYFDGAPLHKFMSLMFKLKDEARKRVPAVAHVDGTSRPQMVERRDNPVYYDLIKEFRSLMGEGLVVNTSFNLAGEPLVETPTDALKSFGYGGLDALYMDGWLIRKHNIL